MNEERAKAAFNIRELTYLLDGGEKTTLVRGERKEMDVQRLNDIL